MKLSVIIPAYNEERYIREVIKKVKKINLKVLNLKKEIIVVNDGSTDRTAYVAASVRGVKVISLPKNYGKGAALRAGLKKTTGDIVITQDSDLEYDPDDIINVVEPIVRRKAAVVYGSRYLDYNQKKRNKSFLKLHKKAYSAFYIGGRLLTFFANVLYGIRITDEATGYKAFRADVIKNLGLKCVRFEFCPEVTAKVAKRGHKILEVPVTYSPRSFEEGKKIKLKDGIEALYTLVKYRFID